MEGAQWFSLCISFFKKKNKTYFPGALGRSSSQIIAQSSVTLSELVVFIPSNWANQRKDGCGGTLTVSGHTFIRSLSCPALNIFMAPHCLAKKSRAFLVSYWNSSSMRGSTSLGLTPTGLFLKSELVPSHPTSHELQVLIYHCPPRPRCYCL